MAELHIQDFQQIVAIDPSDIFNVQRHDGYWKNYRASASAILGLEMVVLEEEYTLAELLSPLEILPDPGADQVYFIRKAWVRYNPGSSNGNQVIKLTGLWWEQNQAFSALLRSSSQGSAATMYWEMQTAEAYSVDRNLRITCEVSPGGAAPTGDGTITVHLEYAIVAL